MQLSTKSRYATRAMIELAINYGNGHIQLKEIARRQNISDKYLEQVLFPLRTKGFVYTQKGNRGGYSLARPPEQITLYDIINNVEGSLAPTTCVDYEDTCDRVNVCVTRDVWARLKNRLTEELNAITLAELAEEQKRKYAEVSEPTAYQI